jgi:hypothetical protein
MAKAKDTTASAVEATDDGTETGNVQTGQAGMTVEERLAAGQKPPESGDPAEGGINGEGQSEGTGEGEGESRETRDEGAGTSEEDKAQDGNDEGTETPEEGKEPEEDGDQDLAEGKIQDGEIKGLSPEIQAKVNARIHKVNIKRKNAEAKTEQTESQLKVLSGKIQDANIQAAMRLGFDPNYITADEAKTLNRFENLRAWRKFLRVHRAGYEGSGTKEDPSMTAEEVAEREAAIEDELMDIGGTARALAMERLALKDADAAVGRKLRLAKTNGGKTSPDAKATGDKPRKVNPKPPTLPSGGATRRPPVSAAGARKSGFDKKEFTEGGADKTALEKQYENIFTG